MIDYREHVDMTLPGYVGKSSDEVKALLSDKTMEFIHMKVRLDNASDILEREGNKEKERFYPQLTPADVLEIVAKALRGEE